MSNALARAACTLAFLLPALVHAADGKLPPAQPETGAVASSATGSDDGVVGRSDDGVVTLRFDEIFTRPVGPLGLELSPKVRDLDGKRVRIRGYMVATEAPLRGAFMLAPLPVELADVDDGPADDLPPNVVHVLLDPKHADATARFERAAIELTGVLGVGYRVEADERVSWLRLQLEAPQATAAAPSTTLTARAGADGGASSSLRSGEKQ